MEQGKGIGSNGVFLAGFSGRSDDTGPNDLRTREKSKCKDPEATTAWPFS